MTNRGSSMEASRMHGWSGRLGDLGLGAAVIAVVAMMVVPLTPWLVDLLISVNITFSVLVLSLSLFIRQPLFFTSFPTLLLVATLYRLALNVSTTRLILIRADAGEIISGFGGYIVGGDILIGAVIFGIMAMVLFLVITKGAERVAEVAARFSLDALPGLQLAIDSDLRAGGISSLEAGRKRAALDQKSRYYGALDGAMKFVRGDAIAGLVITAVNIIGGISVGMLRHDMRVLDAVDLYGRLTVGDGLVTMIPALLISTAAGFLVTRVAGGADERLGEQVGREFIAEPRALGAAAVLLLALSLVHGLPAWPFLLLGALLGGAAFWRFRLERRSRMTQTALSEDADEWRPEAGLAVVEMGEALFSDLSGEIRRTGSWETISRGLAEGLESELGIPVTRVPVVRTPETAPRGARLKIRGMVCQQWMFSSGEGVEAVVGALQKGLRRQADRLIGLDETQNLVHRVARHRPVLVRETLPKKLELPTLTALLRALVADGISLAHLGEVLETLARLPRTDDPETLLERVREGVSAAITQTLTGAEGDIRVRMMAPETESVLEAALVKTESGTRLVFSEADREMIIRAVGEATADDPAPVVVTRERLRRPLARLLTDATTRLTVVKASDIDPDAKVTVLGEIEI